MKKGLIFLLLMLLPIIVLAYKPGDTYIKGDADNNGKVTSTDYIVLRKHILKQTTLTGDAFTRADVTGDNKITSVDYISIRKMILNGKTGEVVTVPGGNQSTVTPKPTVKPTATPILTKEEQICESVKNNSSIDYQSFISLSKKGNGSYKYKDDYYAIKAAHDCANKYNKPVVVTKDTYHVYKPNNETISVQTNTYLNGSTIYIHNDEDIYNYMNAHIYTIEPNSSNKCTAGEKVGFTNAFTSLVPNNGKYYVVITEKGGTKVFNRDHGCESGKTCQEVAKWDAYRVYDGIVQDPMFWDYKNTTIKYNACPIPSDQLVFQNAIIKSVVNVDCNKCSDTSKQRGIAVRRSNTKIYDIDHSFVNSKNKYIHEIKHKFASFFSIQGANVILEQCRVYSMTYRTSSGGHDSTYDLHLRDAVNVTINNVKMSKADENYNQMKSSSDWGVSSSHGSKNVTIINSKLNRIDAHKGIYNLMVKDSSVGYYGINIVGTGDKKDNKLILDNVTFVYSSSIVKMRGDYGTTWNGTISFKNITIKNSMSSSISLISAPSLSNNSKSSFVWNQPIYNPTKVIIDGLTVDSSINKLTVFDTSKNDFNNYYLTYINKKQKRKDNKNEETRISKKNITGVKTITNYTG